MKLSTKLLGGFGILIVIILATGLIGLSQMKAIHDEVDEMAGDWLPSIKTLGRINSQLNQLRRSELAHVLTEVEAEMRDLEKGMAEAKASMDKDIAAYGKLITPEQKEERATFERFQEGLKRYLAIHDQVEGLSKANKNKEAAALASGEQRKVVREAIGLLDQLIVINEKGATKSADDAQQAYAFGRTTLIAALVLGVLIGLGLALLLSKNVLGQLGEDPGYLQQVSSEVAGGNMDVAFKPVQGSGGVYGVLVKMVATLKDKIAEAQQKSDDAARQAQAAQEATREAEAAKAQAESAKAEGLLQAAAKLSDAVSIISSAAEELAAQVEQSSRGAELQAARVGETATSMEEMNATVLEVAKNASQAAETSDLAKTKASEGSGVVGQVVREIGTVERQAEELKEDMANLGQQAEAIGRIMNVISDIADQTNLLALNAAIEAARAGEAGRGFAVVADEVRKLAEKTMTATKEVGDAIRGIQDGTRRNITAVERTVSLIGEATALAGKSGEALVAIVDLVDRTTDQVRSIATASEQQSAASEEINHSVEDISRISTETSDAMRQSSQAVGELAQQAQVLGRLIEELKTEGGGGGGAALPGGRKPRALGA